MISSMSGHDRCGEKAVHRTEGLGREDLVPKDDEARHSNDAVSENGKGEQGMRNTKFTSQRAAASSYSGVREIFNLATQMDDVIHLDLGEPGFPTPQGIVEAAFEATRAGMTHYSSTSGREELLIAIAAQLQEDLSVPFSRAQVVVTAGGMEALLLAFLATLDNGDEVLLPSPHWPNYVPLLQLAGGVAKTVPLRSGSRFSLDLSSLAKSVSSRTRGVILTNPHNPTGMLVNDESLEELARLAADHNLLVFSDEAYETIVYDRKRPSSIASKPGMSERTVIIRSFSKSHAMTGWRIGYLAAPVAISSLASRLHENTSTCASAVSQSAALAALRTDQSIVIHMVNEYQKRRDVLIRTLDRIPRVGCCMPEGAFYAFADIHEFGIPSYEFSRQLLEKAKVAVAPGSAFGKDGEGYVRISFSGSLESIEEGCARIRHFCDLLS